MSANHRHHPQHATGAASQRPRPSRVLGGVAAVLAGAGLAAAPASAEKYPVTQQASTAHAAFLAYAPAPAQSAAMCLIDSGVNLTPDTQGPVFQRDALDGGTVADVDSNGHGTLMAMIAGAPSNDYGMVGAWPPIRIVSVRAERPDGSLSISDYTNAINQCKRESAQTGAKTINLSLGSQGELTQTSKDIIDDAIQRAHDGGLNVVAAAGNSGGALDSPASRPLAFAVGAVDSSAAFCAFSARGDGLDLSAPGCALNVADPSTGEPGLVSGTSESAAFVSGVLTALRSYAPQLGVDDAEALLQSTARTTSVGLVLDAEAAFRAAGLQSVVDAGNARVPAVAPAGTSSTGAIAGGPPTGRAVTPDATPPRTARLPSPRVRVTYRGGVLQLLASSRPKGVVLRIDAYVRNRHGIVARSRSVHTTASRVRLPLRSWDHALVSYEDLYGARPDSRRVTVRHTRTYPPRR